MELSINNPEIYDIASVFYIFSDPTRLKIMIALLDGEKNVKSICESLNIKQSTCSHQLKILKQFKFVGTRRKGQKNFTMLLITILKIFCFLDIHWFLVFKKIVPIS
ncbi:ArsR/SmtB family transcription factor [Marinitoga lauensis]|uniref:ArsR/SmtB family transcription factor n=1 Tax=Marinitoga lauensis TaxID=2201189 RepID=UPI00101179B8|nr:metalloregulator ArsR/SmtB family transcription factor [Marinitoga lauensis]